MPDDSATFRALLQAFERMGWASHRVPGREVLEADFEAHHTRVPLHVQAFGELNAVSAVARSTYSATSGTPHFGPVCELLMRINRDLTIGNFEVDPDSGAILFRATNIFPPGAIDERIVASLVHSCVAEIDRATPYLAVLLKLPAGELPEFRIPELLGRRDLLPHPPESRKPASGS